MRGADHLDGDVDIVVDYGIECGDATDAGNFLDGGFRVNPKSLVRPPPHPTASQHWPVTR